MLIYLWCSVTIFPYAGAFNEDLGSHVNNYVRRCSVFGYKETTDGISNEIIGGKNGKGGHEQKRDRNIK